MSSQEKQKQALAELGAKEEELVVVKVELSSLQEKLKSSVEDVSRRLLVAGCLADVTLASPARQLRVDLSARVVGGWVGWLVGGLWVSW